MNVQKIINELKRKYPGKRIIKNGHQNPTEIICEVDPTDSHPDYDTAIAVIDQSVPHYHNQTTEVYEVIKGTLTLIVNGKNVILQPGERYAIKPGVIHSAKGNEVWIKAISKPGWTRQDHILSTG